MRLQMRVTWQVPTGSWLWSGGIGTRFILTPQLYPNHLSDMVGQLNQALFLCCLWIIDPDHTCFARAQSSTRLAPGSASPECIACLMQHPTDGTGSNVWQGLFAQSPFQQ